MNLRYTPSGAKEDVTVTLYEQDISLFFLTSRSLPVCYASNDIDMLLHTINKEYEASFIGRPSSYKFELSLDTRRLGLHTSLLPELGARFASRCIVLLTLDTTAECCGFVSSYIAYCGFQGYPVNNDIIWDLAKFYPSRQEKKLRIADLLKRVPFLLSFTPSVAKKIGGKIPQSRFRCDLLLPSF